MLRCCEMRKRRLQHPMRRPLALQRLVPGPLTSSAPARLRPWGLASLQRRPAWRRARAEGQSWAVPLVPCPASLRRIPVLPMQWRLAVGVQPGSRLSPSAPKAQRIAALVPRRPASPAVVRQGQLQVLRSVLYRAAVPVRRPGNTASPARRPRRGSPTPVPPPEPRHATAAGWRIRPGTDGLPGAAWPRAVA